MNNETKDHERGKNNNTHAIIEKIKSKLSINKIDYFDIFVNGVLISLESAKYLKLALNNEIIDKEIFKDIKNLEKQGDEHRSKSLSIIETSFITPIDQVDMIEILESIENITDSINYISNHFLILGIEKRDTFMLEFSDLIVAGCEKVYDLMLAFKQFKKNPDDLISKLVAEINKLEEEGDRVYFESMSKLFENDTDPVTIIKKKEIYQLLEEAIDNCEDTADLVERTMLTE